MDFRSKGSGDRIGTLWWAKCDLDLVLRLLLIQSFIRTQVSIIETQRWQKGPQFADNQRLYGTPAVEFNQIKKDKHKSTIKKCNG